MAMSRDRGGGGRRPAGPGDEEAEGSVSHLRLLDGFELTCDGQPVMLTITVQRLLAFLALSDRPLRRPYVAGRLWIDATQGRASASLRSTLWRLRQLGQPVLRATVTHLALVPDVLVDVHRAHSLVRRLIDPADGCEDLVVDARALSSDVLPDWYDDWVIVERERFRQLRLHGLESLCRRLTSRKRFAEAVEAGMAAVSAEPLRESAHRALISAYLAEGNFGEALLQFRRFRSLLRDELGVEPTEALSSLLWPRSPHGDSPLERTDHPVPDTSRRRERLITLP